jgi:hypothetical protein
VDENERDVTMMAGIQAPAAPQPLVSIGGGKRRGAETGSKPGATKPKNAQLAVNTVGVLGEATASVALAAHWYFRAANKAAQEHAFQGVADNGCEPDATALSLYDSDVVKSRVKYRSAMALLNEALKFEDDQFFSVALESADRGGLFELVGEWCAIRELTSSAILNGKLPSHRGVVVLIGRLEILIERIQAFYKEADIEMDHFRE